METQWLEARATRREEGAEGAHLPQPRATREAPIARAAEAEAWE
jgi:hypothetical protein